MHIDPRVEPWIINLLDGVQNSNSHAEVVATAAFEGRVRAASHEALVKALQRLRNEADAALALARGETP